MKVIDGRKVFELIETRGLPLDIIAAMCDNKGYKIDWYKLIWIMYSENWTENTIRNTINLASQNFPYGEQIREKSELIIQSLPEFIKENENSTSEVPYINRKRCYPKRRNRSNGNFKRRRQHKRVLSKFMRERGWRIVSGKISFRKTTFFMRS